MRCWLASPCRCQPRHFEPALSFAFVAASPLAALASKARREDLGR
jgi:hypothetical protein